MKIRAKSTSQLRKVFEQWHKDGRNDHRMMHLVGELRRRGVAAELPEPAPKPEPKPEPVVEPVKVVEPVRMVEPGIVIEPEAHEVKPLDHGVNCIPPLPETPPNETQKPFNALQYLEDKDNRFAFIFAVGFLLVIFACAVLLMYLEKKGV